MCFESILDLLKRVTDFSSFIFIQKVVFVFPLFFNFGAQIRCPQNRYTDFRSALDEPPVVYNHEFGNDRVNGRL